MKKQFVSIAVLGLAFLLLLAVLLSIRPGVGTARAQEPGNGGDTPLAGDAPDEAVADVIPIQGRLTDAGGNPINGTRTITFTLYTSSVGGTVLCQDTDDVTVVNGLFSARMDFCTPSDINGRQLYLGIQAAGDPEMSDRLSILAVPYAWSLRPGSIISGTVADAAILHVDNWATDGRGLRGYARAASGYNYGVLGRSWSPNGYGGYFGNDGGGYALGVEGGMRMSVNAGASKTINVGDRYRDNAIVAWAKIAGTGIGSIQSEFGISSVDHYNTGCYRIYLDISAASSAELDPHGYG